MQISYDPAKNQRNIRTRGLTFDSVSHFDFGSALIEVDKRVEYGEVRFVALGTVI